MDSTQAYGSPDDPGGRRLLGDSLPFGFVAYLGAAASVFFCYIDTLIGLVVPLLGIAPIVVNEHVQAVLMCVFVVVSIVAMARDVGRHGSWLPLMVGLAALLIISGTLYVYYDIRILILGYILLVVAVVLNPAMLLNRLNRSVHAQAVELAALNSALETRVQDQVDEIDRLARLKRFLSSEVADLITSEGRENLLESHRRIVACLFCDVRNFTRFSDEVEPEEVMDVLRSVHETFGELIAKQGGTIGYRAGDGLMVIFNDPLPCEQPVHDAVQLALAMRAGFADVREHWQRVGHEIGFGIGIAYGYATLGMIGTEGRYDYTAIGDVVNLASRLCDEAADGEILVDRRAWAEIADTVAVEAAGPAELKGIGRAIDIYRVTAQD